VFDETSGQVQQVGDIRPGAAGSNPHELTAAGNRLYYVADDGQYGYELWQVDTADGSTALVSDLYAGYTGSCPRDLTAVGDRLFFVAKNGSQNPNADPPTYAKEIWMAYETAGAIGVELTADLNPTTESSGSSAPKNLAWVFGTTLAFSAFEPNFGQELYLFDWQSDEAPRRLTDLNPFAESSYPANFVHLNGSLYFTAHNSNNEEHIWAYSLAADTISCLTAGLPHPYPRNLAPFQQTLYFTAAYAAGGRKLWATDGTRTGLVVEADSGLAQQTPANLTIAADRLYYTAFDAELGEELYQLANP
jgi:ELWxxDGT repeat protein